ncbi:MAG: UDP-N-acetylmuramoyl-L-alanine--D-glutamate ligase [Clostridia bacterium]|nr:UDP-N-acetylmuramoyl-L-alanine--D-glutamate ligase [Clostridia bacterium]
MKFVNKKLEEFNNYIKNKKVAIIGLGVSNIPLIDYLYNLGSEITLFNNKTIEELDKNVMDRIYEYKLNFSFGEKYLSKLNGFDIIFRSPSCRPDLPEIQEEVDRGAILTSEIELVLEMCPGTTIGITGSDGKTTTTSLIYEILKEENLKCYLGGNIGIPLFTKISEMKPEDYVVLELSSFQLMTMNVSPNVAVITNVTPNHLDIHKSYEEYINSKANIFKYQKENDLLVLNNENEITKNFAKYANGRLTFFSSKTKLDDGVILDNDIIKICDGGLRRHIVDTKNIKLRGIHNSENICTAIAATKDLVSVDSQIKAITNFRGVKHRLEFVKEINGAKWYNDSIASSPTRTIAGLNSFSENIVLIAGGYDKHLEYTPIAKPIIDNVGSLILLGQTAEKIKNAVEIELKNSNKDLNIYKVETLEEAVIKAKEICQKGDVVLFSPASASFDMFKNFEERGNKFKQIVNEV